MERGPELDLPGFRFHPTEEELLDFYLRRVVYGRKKLGLEIIGTLNIYRHEPWELPMLAKIGEREWFFYVPRDRKQANGGRPNRTTERGFWKATGTDRPIRSAADPKRLIGLKKTLVFYGGRAPRGSKTDWVMNEYRLPSSSFSASVPQDDIVLCKIYRKATSLKELEQRACIVEEMRPSQGCVPIVDSSNLDNFQRSPVSDDGELKEGKVKEVGISSSSFHPLNPPELQVPDQFSLDWIEDSLLTPMISNQWFEQLSPYANMLDF